MTASFDSVQLAMTTAAELWDANRRLRAAYERDSGDQLPPIPEWIDLTPGEQGLWMAQAMQTIRHMDRVAHVIVAARTTPKGRQN